jgi:predicted alpha/beta hydrolase family esterase
VSKLNILLVPGWKDSGPAHWQSHWERRLPGVERLRMKLGQWEFPRRESWVKALSQALLAEPSGTVVVAHSLGCIAVRHLPPEVAQRIGAALFVAPADPERRAVLADFAPVPYGPLPYPSIVVGSTDDPYCPIRKSAKYARSWGSRMVKLDAAGHINSESGYGPWTEGLVLLDELVQRAVVQTPLQQEAA